MKPINVADEVVQMKAFPFSLCDATKAWLFSQTKPITGWEEMKRKFLGEFLSCIQDNLHQEGNQWN